MSDFPILKIRTNGNGTHTVELDGVDISNSCTEADLFVKGGPGPVEAYLRFSVFLDVEVAAEVRRAVGLPQAES